MSMIDYGALLRVNGKFINKNCGLFMHCSDTGYICDKATYFNSYQNKEDEININGNYYVYAGDKNFLLCFYKRYFYVIHNNKVIHTVIHNQFLSETFYLDGFPSVTVEHLDKNFVKRYYNKPEDLDRKWLIQRHGKKNGLLRLSRWIKHSRKFDKELTNRWKATWDYNGNHYEVIFGSGIDPNEETWNRIKFDSYGFTNVEREIIDSWFNGD